MERQLEKTLDKIHPGHVERYKFASERVSGRILDAACGCGYGSKMMNGGSRRVVGIDIEEEAIYHARQYFKGPGYLCGDLMKAPWVGHFDWVVSLETLEHLPDPETVLKLFRESCEQGIFSTPNQAWYPFDPKKFEGDHYPHLRHWKPDEFDSLLSDCGWTTVERHSQPTKVGPVKPGVEGMFLIFVCE